MSKASKKEASKVVLFSLVLLIMILLQGCQSTPTQAEKSYLDMENGSLYLSNQPYDQLYVEIDTLKGTRIPEGMVDEIRHFLNEHCSKPGGITIVEDPPVSFEQEELSAAMMALLCTDGPVGVQGKQAAYLHVFFYDTDLKGVKAFTEATHIQSQCPTTVFFNTDYARILHSSVQRDFIRHEIGHIFGLTGNTSHGDGLHCNNRNCLMYQSTGSLSVLCALFQIPMKDNEFCNNCTKDINTMKSLSPDNRTSFKGPFLLEHESENVKLSLPYFTIKIDENRLASLSWQKLLLKLKDEVAKKHEQLMEKINAKNDDVFFYPKYEP